MEFKYRPTDVRDVMLSILKYHVDDDHFLRVLAEISQIIRASAKLCDERGDEFAEDEVGYIEEFLGLSFVVLQAKIRRISKIAKNEPFKLNKPRALCAPYKNTGKSPVELIWAIGNCYKHCNEWNKRAWNNREDAKIVKDIGIERFSTGNMRQAYNYFQIDWASDCTPLADKVREWANTVYEKCANP